MRPLLPLLSALPLALLAAACGGSNTTTSSHNTGGASSSATSTSSTSMGTGGMGTGGAAPMDAPTLVMTKDGPVQATVEGDSRVFYAIPFAAPPIGDLRWKPPQPPTPWTKPLAANAPGPECPQLDALTSTMLDSTSSEDCLTLNVWAPKEASATPRPVMLWIFGGSFVIGSAGMFDYNGQKLSEATGAIVVTVNYRLGPLGFLALQALHGEDASHPSSGMYGIEDQRAAIAWMQANAAAFGGDPKNITVFGESAGGISTCTHLISPPSDGLFQHAIIESGACATGNTATETTADTQGLSFVKALGCDGKSDADTLTCIRAASLSKVMLALPTSPFNFLNGGVAWGPVIDGLNLPDDPVKLFKAGSFQHVPTMLGTNTDEGTLFFALSSPISSDSEYQTFADALFPGQGATIVMQYPSSMYGSPTAAASAAVSDAGFACPARRVARAMAGAGVPTYRYHFAHDPQHPLLMGLGAFHSSEIPFIFGNYTELEPGTPTMGEMPLLATMQGYWGRMGKAGDPNGSGAVMWPKYDTTTEPDIVLDLKVTTETAYKKADCDFWDKLQGI